MYLLKEIQIYLKSPLICLIDVKVIWEEYIAAKLSPLRKWLDLKGQKDTSINSEFELSLSMGNKVDVKLVKLLQSVALPPFERIKIYDLDNRINKEVNDFLSHSMGQVKELMLNPYGIEIKGHLYEEGIIQAIPKVTEGLYLLDFDFSKEQVEKIVDNSHHLESLNFIMDKLRK